MSVLLNRLLRWLLRIIWNIPFLSRLVSRLAISYLASRTPPRPRPFSLWSAVPKPPGEQNGPVNDYTSWPGLTDRSYSGRHLPPADPAYVAALPIDAPYDFASQRSGQVTALFARQGAMKPDRSSLLFMFFAQWFTDSVLRIDPLDRRKNTSNHDVDLCQIYGLDEATCRLLRLHQGGRLRSQMLAGEEYLDYLHEPDGAGGWVVKPHYQGLPYAGRIDQLMAGFPLERRQKMYATGLERGNSSVGYVAISTIFMREHNRICADLQLQHPGWNDERLFQTARMINIVLLLKLVVEDYINHIAGFKLFRLDTTFAERRCWYRTNWIALEFDLLYRWHGLVPDVIEVAGNQYAQAEFRNNNALLEQAGVAQIISSASSQAAGRIGLFNTPDFLLGAEYQSLKMGRDFRLRSYNDYRERFGFRRFSGFSALSADTRVQQTLQKLYGDIDRLEYLVGIFAEDRAVDGLFGNLMNQMVAYDAFTQIFTNPLLSRHVFNAATFTDYGLQLIRDTGSIEDLVRRNIAAGTGVRATLAV